MKILLIVIVIVVAAGIGFYAYFGGFKKIPLQIREEGGETLVYEEVKGDYKNTAAVMEIYDIPNGKILYRKELKSTQEQ